MFNLKKAMAVAMTVALMVPSTAFAATPHLQKLHLAEITQFLLSIQVRMKS